MVSLLSLFGLIHVGTPKREKQLHDNLHLRNMLRPTGHYSGFSKLDHSITACRLSLTCLSYKRWQVVTFLCSLNAARLNCAISYDTPTRNRNPALVSVISNESSER